LFWDAMVGNEIMILWYTGKLYLRHVIQLFIFIIKLALPDPVLAYVLDWKPSVEPELMLSPAPLAFPRTAEFDV